MSLVIITFIRNFYYIELFRNESVSCFSLMYCMPYSVLTFRFLVFVMLSGILVSHSALCFWFSIIHFLIAHPHAFICSHDVIPLCISTVDW
jgi:hypothetical protein